MYGRLFQRLGCPLVLALSLNGCGGKNSGSPPSLSGSPGTPVPINTGTGWSDSPHISRDGQRLYFMYSRYNFGPWILSGGATAPVVSGPDRPGLHKSDTNAFDESDIYVATKNGDGSWSEPVPLGFNGAYGDSSGMEIDDGNTFVWLRGDGSSSRIVMAHKNPDQTWGAPIDFGSAINDSATQDNPHISASGDALWFTSNRAGGVGGKDIWFSWLSAGVWVTPVNMGAVNSAGDEDQMWVSPVSADVYWNGPSGIMHCVWSGSGCSAAPTVVVIPGCDYAAEVSLPDDGQTMYFACGDTTTGMVTIMYSTKQLGGDWGTATPVD